MKHKVPSTRTSSVHFRDDESSKTKNGKNNDVMDLDLFDWLIEEKLYQFESNWICDVCGEFFFDICDCEEVVDQKHSPEMRILLRLSSNHYTNQSKFENAFYTAMSVDETVNILLKSIKTVNDNIRYLGDELIKNQNSLQHLSQECSLMKTDFHQQSKSDHDMIEQKFLAIRQSMEDLHYATHDGSFIWKIENFAKTFDEARSERQISIYSPSFYSSRYGYKMRVQLNMYGDGDAQGTHMSIFLIILRGEYDSTLSWPFVFSVTFCLLDQINQKHNIIDLFYPDTNSASFQRPQSDMNIASGIPTFCSLASVEQKGNCYIQNDTMFIKITVDFDKTPREYIACTSIGNSGLPTHMQDDIDHKKIEELKQLRAELDFMIDRREQEVSQQSCSIPVYSQAPARIPPSSIINSQGIQCEDT